jgi:hypothetical protein
MPWFVVAFLLRLPFAAVFLANQASVWSKSFMGVRIFIEMNANQACVFIKPLMGVRIRISSNIRSNIHFK